MNYEQRMLSILTQKPKGNRIAAVDLGEVHPFVVYDGDKVMIVNGRELRSKKRLRNKTAGTLDSLIAKTRKGSRRNKRLKNAKKEQLKALDNQILDIMRKQTSCAISTLHEAGVHILAVGDIRNIRYKNDLGRKANQKTHQTEYVNPL